MAALKPSTKFARWMKANSARLADDKSEQFKLLVVTVSTLLTMLEESPKGVGAVMTDYALEKLRALDIELAKRGMDRPDITLPKIKVVGSLTSRLS